MRRTTDRPTGATTSFDATCRRLGARGRSTLGAVAVAAAVASASLGGCGNSGAGGGPGLSVTDRIATASACAQVVVDLRSVIDVGAKLASQSISLSASQQQLQPIQAKVDKLAQSNAALPLAAQLRQLATVIGQLDEVQSTNPSDYTSIATALGSAAQAVVSGCAAVGR